MSRSAVLARSMEAGLARARRRRPTLPSMPLDILCFCHGLERATLIEAILSGADTLDKIQATVGATTGPCGGSCSPCVQALIDQTLGREQGQAPCSPETCTGNQCAGDRQGSTESDETSSQSEPRPRR